MQRVATLFALFVLAAAAQAANPVSIGYVDMQRVILESKQGKAAQSALEKKYEAPQKQLGEEEQAIRQIQQKTSRDAALMSQAELDKRSAELQGRIQKFQQQALATQEELGKDKAKLGGNIVKAANEIIAKLAEERKLSAVFERSASGLLYIQDGLNLTDEVVKRLNALPTK
jgi:outer membrane protein